MALYQRTGTIGARVRKNAKELTPDEWSRFVNALKVIKVRSRPGGVISIFDEFSALHMGAVEIHRTWRRAHPDINRNDLGNSDPAHDNPGFLPWHRQFLWEFESALQAVDPAVTLPYWDWTDREFNKKLFSPSYMGGNGGHDGKGGAVVNGPFTLDGGWVVNPVLHRPTWFVGGGNGTTLTDPTTHTWAIQPSLGRSIVRYMGDFEDLATPADIIEFTKRKPAFGPEKLIIREDLIPINPNSTPDPSPTTDTHGTTEAPNAKPLPRGTLHIGDSLPSEAVPPLPWLVNQASGGPNTLETVSDGNPTMEKIGDSDWAFREDVQGFRWGVEGSPHMHNQTHDWFGYHTTILQDDDISGAASMPNVGCSTADPIFFMHHCNIDRLWAEWQDAGHYGSIFFPKRTDPLKIYATVQDAIDGIPIRSYTYPNGHSLDDYMWPWDNNAMSTQQELQFMLPQYPYSLTPRDLLDYQSLGYSYDTSTQLAVNSVTPVVVYLPSVEGKVTRQVFPLSIQRDAPYLIAAWNKGKNQADLSIAVYEKYEEKFEIDFLTEGFKGQAIPSIPNSAPPDSSKGFVWKLSRGTYFVVITATVETKPTTTNPSPKVDARYEVGVATSPSNFSLPDIPFAPGVITNPQVPTESCVFLPNRRYAPINLEDGKPQFRLTQMKGTHELFGINVEHAGGFADVKFEGMDALVQLYGPFGLDADSLPHFDTNGEPAPGDNQTYLSSQLQIASSEGCCKRLGSGIGSLVTPGRYVLIIFHCSIGINEYRPYKVTYTLNKSAVIPPLRLGSMLSTPPSVHSRSVNELYRVEDTDGSPLVTQLHELYKVNIHTDDAATQGQVRVAVFTYASSKVPADGDAPEPIDENHYVSHDCAYWGKWEVTFEPYQDQVMFIRVSILNGFAPTNVKIIIQRV